MNEPLEGLNTKKKKKKKKKPNQRDKTNPWDRVPIGIQYI
jgi:hypothetical protein